MRTVIIASHVFDGSADLGEAAVIVDDGVITSVGEPLAVAAGDGAEVIEAPGATLLPGLIDSHVHTNESALRLALRFGVTTELEMQGVNTANDRAHISDDDTLADVRSAGFGLTPPGGHPEELFPKDAQSHRGGPPGGGTVRPRHDPLVRPGITCAEEAVDFVGQLSRAGSDYIKFMVDDGTVEGAPGLPMLDQQSLDAGVTEAHRLGMLTVAHALTLDAARMCIDAGIDGLAHLFMDRPHTADIIAAIADSGMFVIACVTLDATLRSSFAHYPQGRLDDVLASLRALDEANVDLLVGTDVSQPLPFVGGLAHGASVHQEMQYFVDAGLSETTALRSATSIPARRFGLTDRGMICEGMRADLLLVDGDPTTVIGDSLNVRDVWRRGRRLAAAG